MKPGRFILSGLGLPSFNMALDEAIFTNSSAPTTLRFYEWEPPGLSLGFFQHSGDFKDLEERGLAIVRRITGGGAIYHHHELTLSIRLPLPFPGIPRHFAECYERLHQPVLEVLNGLGIAVRLRGPSAADPQGEPLFCFDRKAPFDIVHGKWKVAGSAQRRKKGVLFQQTSILFRKNPYAQNGIGLEEILQRSIPSGEIIPLLKRAYEVHLGIALFPQEESSEEKRRTLELMNKNTSSSR